MSNPFSVLILCTGNSCRSILAEVLFRDLGRGRFVAYSAGSNPTGTVHPDALQKLQREGHATEGLSSKSWEEFSQIPLDFVITVCDSAAGESCPVWRGAPVTAHWGIADPAAADSADLDAAFARAYRALRERIEAVMELPLDSMDVRYHKDALQRIHEAASMREKGAAP